MLYDEVGASGGPIPLSGRRPVRTDVTPSAAARAAIVRVASDHTSWGPKRIHAELRIGGHPGSLEEIEVVLAEIGR